MEQGFKDNKAELEKLRKEMQEKEQRWQEEKEEMRKRLAELESKTQRQEKYEKRNNIVIKGVKTSSTNIEEEIENMIKTDIGVEVKVIEAYNIGKPTGKNIIVARLEQWKQKTLLMRNKSKLRGKNYYIDDDLTKEEQEIQRKKD